MTNSRRPCHASRETVQLARSERLQASTPEMLHHALQPARRVWPRGHCCTSRGWGGGWQQGGHAQRHRDDWRGRLSVCRNPGLPQPRDGALRQLAVAQPATRTAEAESGWQRRRRSSPRECDPTAMTRAPSQCVRARARCRSMACRTPRPSSTSSSSVATRSPSTACARSCGRAATSRPRLTSSSAFSRKKACCSDASPRTSTRSSLRPDCPATSATWHRLRLCLTRDGVLFARRSHFVCESRRRPSLQASCGAWEL